MPLSVALLVAVLGVLLTPTAASAHGFVIQPMSRQAACQAGALACGPIKSRTIASFSFQ